MKSFFVSDRARSHTSFVTIRTALVVGVQFRPSVSRYFFHTAEFDGAKQAGEDCVLCFRASEVPAWTRRKPPAGTQR